MQKSVEQSGLFVQINVSLYTIFMQINVEHGKKHHKRTDRVEEQSQS